MVCRYMNELKGIFTYIVNNATLQEKCFLIAIEFLYFLVCTPMPRYGTLWLSNLAILTRSVQVDSGIP